MIDGTDVPVRITWPEGSPFAEAEWLAGRIGRDESPDKNPDAVRAQAGGYYNRNIKTYYAYQNG